MSELETQATGTEGAPVWLITGASSGLGLALARVAAARGFTVVATDRTVANASDISQHEYTDRITTMELDVTDPRAIDAVAREVLQRHGHVDVLVNNAGRVQIGAVEELEDSELRALFELHAFGPFRLMQRVLPSMRARRRGTIVQMSTMGAFFISPGFGAYTASKAALEGLSATLSQEVEQFGIEVVIVEPGAHRTGVFSPGSVAFAARNSSYEEVIGSIPSLVVEQDGGQPGDPARAAEIIVDIVVRGNPPLRLPLGGDAVEVIRDALHSIDLNMRTYEPLARSTAFDSPREEPPASVPGAPS